MVARPEVPAAELASVADDTLDDLLRCAEDEERSLADRRTVLQGRVAHLNCQIDDLDARVRAASQSLAALLEEEQVLATRRARLQRRVAELRRERSRRAGGSAATPIH